MATDLSNRRSRVLLWSAAVLVSLPPLVINLAKVVSEPTMQYLDYWSVIGRVMDPGGGLEVSNLVAYQNEHLLVLPSIVYWLNYRLTGGYAWTLAVFVVCVIAVTIGLLTREVFLVIRDTRVAALALVGISWLLFTPRGVANIAIPMSGTAWCLANLLNVLALLLALRRRWWLSLAMCLAATFTYGTGLASWWGVAAVCVVFAVTDEPTGAARWRSAAWGAASACVTLLVILNVPPHGARTSGGAALPGRVRNVLQTAGAISSDEGLSAALGVVVLTAAAVTAVGTWWLLRERPSAPADSDEPQPGTGRPEPQVHAAALGIGLAAMCLFMPLAVGAGRSGGGDIGLSSRYASVTGFAWIGAGVVIAMAVLLFARRAPRALVAAPFLVLVMGGVLSFASSERPLERFDEIAQEQRLVAISIKLGEDRFAARVDASELRSAGHVPFGTSYGDCGLLGSALDPSEVRDTVEGMVDSATREGTLLHLHGWIDNRDHAWDCLAIVSDGRVIGAGTTGMERDDVRSAGLAKADSGFLVLLPGAASTSDLDLVAITEGGHRARLDEGAWRKFRDDDDESAAGD